MSDQRMRLSVSHSPLVGRDRELAALGERLDLAARGEGNVVFLSGDPGIGKSRLLGELSGSARKAGWLTLAGRAYDMDGMPPYLPIVEVIRGQLRNVSDEALRSLAADAPELCLLLPDIRSRVAAVPDSPSPGPVVERFRLFDAIAGFLVGVARQTEIKGLVVLLDDLHWADRSTFLFIQHLARKLGGTPLLVVGAYRSTGLQSDHPLENVIADLARERLCEQILVPPLSEAAASAMIANLVGTPAPGALTSTIYSEAGGNPFFTEELVRHLFERGWEVDHPVIDVVPASIRQVLEQRLTRLSPATNEVLRAAAIVGESCTFELLAAVSGLESEPLTDALEQAIWAGMLTEEGVGYALTHALIRRTLYDSISTPRRRQAHLRAAEAIESRSNELADTALATVAHHWRLGGHPERATDYLLRAGNAALSLTAWHEGAALWEAALECMELSGDNPARRARLLEGLGDLHFLSSFEAHPCVECYERASRLYQSVGDARSAARARSRAGRSLAYPTSGFDYARALEHLRAAEKVLGQDPPSVEMGELYAAIVHAETHALRHNPDEMLESLRLVETISEKLDNEFLSDFLHVQSLHLRGHYLGLQGRLAEGLALEELACDTALALNDKGGSANDWSARWREFLLAYSSDGGAETAADAGSFQFSRVHSRAGLCTFTRNCCGWQLLDLHDPLAARAKHEQLRDPQGRFLSPFLLFDLFLSGDTSTLRQLVEAGLSALSGVNPGTMLTGKLLVAWIDGRWAEVDAGYVHRAQEWGAQGARGLAAWYDHPLLWLARVRGDAAAASTAAHQLLDIALSSGAVKYEFYARAELALLLAETGDLARAEDHLAHLREILALGEDWRGLGGRAALAEAVFAAASGNGTVADEHFQRALGCFTELSLPWDEAETCEIWARFGRRFHRGHNRRAFLADQFDRARAIYVGLEAGQPWLDRLASLQSSLSANHSPAESPAARPGGLSEREIEVLRLIASGRTNQQIATRLYISLNTVARHVSHIYDKTGAANRADAASYAGRHGLLE